MGHGKTKLIEFRFCFIEKIVRMGGCCGGKDCFLFRFMRNCKNKTKTKPCFRAWNTNARETRCILCHFHRYDDAGCQFRLSNFPFRRFYLFRYANHFSIFQITLKCCKFITNRIPCARKQSNAVSGNFCRLFMQNDSREIVPERQKSARSVRAGFRADRIEQKRGMCCVKAQIMQEQKKEEKGKMPE